jgi:hypothetical protein
MRFRVRRLPWNKGWSRNAPINEGFSGGKPHSGVPREWKGEDEEGEELVTFQAMGQQTVFSGRVESVFYPSQLGGSQEEVQKKTQLGTTQ